MAEAEDIFEESVGESEKKSEADKLFESLPDVESTAKRSSSDTAGGGNGGNGDNSGGHGDIEWEMTHSRKKSDIQSAYDMLFPEIPVEWLKHLRISRVFPDAFNYMLSLGVKELLRTTKMTMGEAVAYVESVLTIAIDGEGRLDGIHIIVHGGVEEQKDQNKVGMTP